ncbi:MAG: Holliday junction resolvase RuvX [Actinomycetes bacterium]
MAEPTPDQPRAGRPAEPRAEPRAERRGVRIGVDVGSVRVGVALSDPEGRLATPLETLARGEGDLDRLVGLVAEHDALEVVVGLPRTLRGEEGAAAIAARGYATSLAGRIAPVPVRLVDERLSTVRATRGLQAAGVDARRARSVVDQAAAVEILQHALDSDARARPGVSDG